MNEKYYYVDCHGDEIYKENGDYHRTDGPAIADSYGRKHWYINGQQIRSDKDFQKAAKLTDEEMTLIILKYGNVE